MSETAANERCDRLVSELDQQQLNLLLVTDLFNLRWLTGFTGTNGAALVGKEQRTLFTDFRYTEQARRQTQGFELCEIDRDLFGSIGQRLPNLALKLGFDDRHLTVYLRDQLAERLPGAAELTPAGGLVEKFRAVKSADELAKIAAAAGLADEAFKAVLAGGLSGHSEADIAWRIEREMRELGAEAASFPPIVAAAENGALPHAVPSSEKIPVDTLVVIDWGAVIGGYCSDCTRTVATGSIPAEMESVYQFVFEAQQAALARVGDEVKTQEVDATAREVIEAAGHGSEFGHGTGHGVGLEVHEAPKISRNDSGELACGNVVTIEPGVYVRGKFGVRIEDLVVVRENRAEVLTGTSKELRVVD